jgi:asparagine synthase (glutamine-hydrolysing)
MCGIAGIFGSKAAPETLRVMLSAISHRGDPEHQGELTYGEGFAIGANRLAIIDESGGRQPARSLDGLVHCVQNGEIYNYEDLRAQLVQRHEFASQCDTEVILKAWLEYGPSLVQHLEGMYAFAVNDQRDGRWLIARDPLGIKPLYYFHRGDSVFFASELKALCALGGAESIHALAPGSTMDASGITKYAQAPHFAAGSVISDSDGLELVRTALSDAVRSHLPRSGERVAVLLSGGIDSSTVLYLAHALHGGRVEAFTTAIDSGPSQDREASEGLCARLGVPLRIVPATPAELQDIYLRLGVRITETFEPALIRNATLYYHLCSKVRSAGYKFCLSGEGADEVFGGYDYFKAAPVERRDALIQQSLHEIHATYLQMADRASMFASLEVRVPYMDYKFVQTAAALPPSMRIRGSTDKWVLRSIFPEALPEKNRTRSKIGMNGGAGLGTNDPGEGIYSAAVQEHYASGERWRSDLAIATKHRDTFRLDTKNREEVYDFARYVELGYIRHVRDPMRPLVNVSPTHNTKFSDSLQGGA